MVCHSVYYLSGNGSYRSLRCLGFHFSPRIIIIIITTTTFSANVRGVVKTNNPTGTISGPTVKHRPEWVSLTPRQRILAETKILACWVDLTFLESCLGNGCHKVYG